MAVSTMKVMLNHRPCVDKAHLKYVSFAIRRIVHRLRTCMVQWLLIRASVFSISFGNFWMANHPYEMRPWTPPAYAKTLSAPNVLAWSMATIIHAWLLNDTKSYCKIDWPSRKISTKVYKMKSMAEAAQSVKIDRTTHKRTAWQERRKMKLLTWILKMVANRW